MMTVSSVSRTPRLVWPPIMPQHETRRPSCDYDAIDPDFPPPSLKTPQTESGREQEKRKKKDKRWSIGGLFRRKKKVSDTDSSSPVEEDEEEKKKGFLERRKAAKKRRNRGSKDVTDSFEHVIINPTRHQIEVSSPDKSTLSNERLVGRSHESLPKRNQEGSQVRGSSVSLEGVGRKGGRIQIKARVEASRERIKGESSSDEGGGSSRTSSNQRLKSDETSGSKDGSLSRRSRAARTERYKKRLSRDEESLRDFQLGPVSRVSRSDEKLSNKKTDKSSSGSRWTAKVVYCESSDYDTKYTAKTKSATPSPLQSPKSKPRNALHYTSSAPPNYVTFPPSHAREGVVGSYQELRGHYTPGVAQNNSKSHQRYADLTPPRLPKCNSDMINKSMYPNSVQKQYCSWGQDNLNRKSASYDCNVNSLHFASNQISQPHPTDENVLVVQFPISRPTQKTDTKVNKKVHSSQILSKQQNPPPPPPRDPHRRLVTTNGHHHEASPRPMSYAFEDKPQHQTRYPGFTEFGSKVSAFHRVPQTTPIEFEPSSTINKHHRSNSDHQIPSRIITMNNSPPAFRRPSSVQAESVSKPNDYLDSEHFAKSPPSDRSVPNHYQYYTDQQPRSRKPIHISYQNNTPANDPYLSDSQVIIKPPVLQNRSRPPGVQNATEFWKQKDQESTKKVHLSEGSPKLIQRHLLNVASSNERPRSISPHKDNKITSKLKLPPLIMPVRGMESTGSISSQSSPRDIPSPRTPSSRNGMHNEIGIPVFENAEISNAHKREYRPLSMLEEKQEISEQEVSPARERLNNQPPPPPKRRDSKVNAVTSFEQFDIFDDDMELQNNRRESSNLEDALNELEAIYKSLKLGEEGYIEKIEKEKAHYENNRLDPSNWNAWVQSRGFESDSSFNYSRSSLDSVDSIDSPLRKPNSRKTGTPNTVTDDMAYRRLNKKDRPPPHEQEVISQAGSFLLVSPTLSPPPFIETPPVLPVKNEPDVTLDDVVYRNIKHVNNTLKVLDPQPPFGIPLGPITPAPNSDYLHVTPKENYRPTFKPRKTPDVVADDLAFRNLRKDGKGEPLFTPEDTTLIDSPTLKKKRAVRSLSANLLSIIQRESMAMNNNNKLLHNNNIIQRDLEKSQSFSDVADALNVSENISKGHLVEESKFNGFNAKRNLSGDDSDATPRASRHISTGSSTPLIATSTETLTGSKSSLWTQDSKSILNIIPQTASPRLSLTPERRHTTDNFHAQLRKSASPSKHVPIKIEPLNISVPKSLTSDIQRSPTPDSHTFTHHNDIKENHSPLAYNETESDLLADLAREAKEASEQLSKELNELNFDRNTKVVEEKINGKSAINNAIKKQDYMGSDFYKQDTISSPFKPLQIGKIVTHKPVKLNTFCITGDNKLENKQTVVMNSPGEIECSKSMADLLKELTRNLDFDFGSSPEGLKKLPSLNTEDKTQSAEDQTKREKKSIETTAQESISELRTSDIKESDKINIHPYEESPNVSPERVHLSLYPEESRVIELSQDAQTVPTCNKSLCHSAEKNLVKEITKEIENKSENSSLFDLPDTRPMKGSNKKFDIMSRVKSTPETRFAEELEQREGNLASKHPFSFNTRETGVSSEPYQRVNDQVRKYPLDLTDSNCVKQSKETLSSVKTSHHTNKTHSGDDLLQRVGSPVNVQQLSPSNHHTSEEQKEEPIHPAERSHWDHPEAAENSVQAVGYSMNKVPFNLSKLDKDSVQRPGSPVTQFPIDHPNQYSVEQAEKRCPPVEHLPLDFPQKSSIEDSIERLGSPVNKFPLELPDYTARDDPAPLALEVQTSQSVSRDRLPAEDSRDPEGCSRDCSHVADEGTKPHRLCADTSTLLVCMACVHQLAGLDILTILGLILAMASLILFLIL